jgi:quercetin dioxygenase-like cupin family protein
VKLKTRTRVVIGAGILTSLVVGFAFATPTVGLLVGTILSTGTINKHISVQVHVALPSVTSASGETGDADDWEASVHTSGPSNIIVQDVVYAPGGHTGWHSHPGILLSSVISGSIEWYDSKCAVHVYNAGDSLTESTQAHYVRNVGSENAHFMVTYMIAAGQPRRIDQPAPACAAALGLN